MPIAYSYVRFSSQKQKHGASLERQLEAATTYAHTHFLVLDTSTYKDLGVSAFRSKNAQGALGAFIEAVNAGRIADGSYLLIESLDRLSRADVPTALEQFLTITNKGIVIVTLTDQQIYSKATIKDRWTDLVVALSVMARAHEESATKSMRAHDAIERRRARGEIVTTRLPTWMRFAEDRKSAKLIPERAAIIRQIFERTLEGEGARPIVRWLQAKKVPVLFYAKEWRQSAVSQLLKNPAAYGHFKGVDGALPAVISKAQWLKVQNITKTRRKWGTGSLNTPSNTFAGLAFCGHCDKRMRLIGSKDSHYLKCIGSTDLKNCKGRMFPLRASEGALVYELAHRGKHNVGSDFFREQNDRREELETEIVTQKARQQNLLQLSALAEGIEVVAIELRRLQDQIDTLEAELKGFSIYPLSKQDAHENAALFDAFSKLTNPALTDWKPAGDLPKTLVEFRQKLKVILHRLLKRIDFHNGKKGWSPHMTLTYVSDKQATIDITEWLPARTQVRLASGTPHRSDLGKGRRPSTKKRSRAL